MFGRWFPQNESVRANRSGYAVGRREIVEALDAVLDQVIQEKDGNSSKRQTVKKTANHFADGAIRSLDFTDLGVFGVNDGSDGGFKCRLYRSKLAVAVYVFNVKTAMLVFGNDVAQMSDNETFLTSGNAFNGAMSQLASDRMDEGQTVEENEIDAQGKVAMML